MISHPMGANINTVVRWEEIKRLPVVQYLAQRKVLDVGSGLGFFSVQFAERGARVLAVDKEEKSLRYLQSAYGIETKVLDIERDALPDGNFDIVYLGDVLEHVSEYQKIIEKAKETLLPGGYLIVTSPALEGLFSRSKGKRMGHFQGTQRHLRDGFYADELKEALRKAGIKFVHHSYCIFFFSELFMQVSKYFYLKKKKTYVGQSDVITLTQTTAYRFLQALFPFLMALFWLEGHLCKLSGMPGHCHVVVGQKIE